MLAQVAIFSEGICIVTIVMLYCGTSLSGHLYKQDTFICLKCHICVYTSEMRTPHYSGHFKWCRD